MVDLNFDFDVVTGPSHASCPALPDDAEPEEERSLAGAAGKAAGKASGTAQTQQRAA